MAVEKVTIQQAAGDLLKGTTPETTADTNSFNTKINPFLLGEKTLEQAQKSGEQYSANNKSGLIFGSKILEEPKVKEAASEIPQADKSFSFQKLANYVKSINAGINRFDKAVNVVNNNFIPESNIADAYLSNYRLQAVVQQGILAKRQTV